MPSHELWLDRLPKVELHLHLEGSVPLDVIWELVQKYGGDPAVPSRDALRERYRYRDFPHFIETWLWQAEYLREYEDFTRIAEAVARDLRRQRHIYVEAFLSPPDYFRHGLETGRLLEAVRAGLARVPEVEIALVPDLVRNYGPRQAARVLAEVHEARAFGVIGIGIGGGEHEHPPEPFAPVYAEARRLGLHTSAHAGEAAGAASIWGALRSLRAERIGHGTRAEEDPALVDYLAEHQVPLELCPTSNVLTGVVESFAAHPARRYFERGLLVTVNTDDPAMFNCSLAGELARLEAVHGFTRDDIRRLLENAVRASWLPEQRKDALLREMHADRAWVGEESRPEGRARPRTTS